MSGSFVRIKFEDSTVLEEYLTANDIIHKAISYDLIPGHEGSGSGMLTAMYSIKATRNDLVALKLSCPIMGIVNNEQEIT
jgi:hypothetical protein